MTVQKMIQFQDVPRLSQPITKIPKYVFENCNQATCHDYDPKRLKVLRDVAKVIKLDQIKGESEEERTKKAEEFDWVCGLDHLETVVLCDPKFQESRESYFSLENIIVINGIFSRLCNKQSGQYRSEQILWEKRSFEPAEAFVAPKLIEYFDEVHGKDWFSTLSNHPYQEPKLCLLPIGLLGRLFSMGQNGPEKFANLETGEMLSEEKKKEAFNYSLFSQWITEYREGTTGKLNMTRWFEDRYHFFPSPSRIRSDLQKVLIAIRDPKMHPIEKASRIWLEIVRVHISHEANKRTGKAIGSAILLSYGYLPPKISKEDTKEYMDTLYAGMEEEGGQKRFTQFIARKIVETTKEYGVDSPQSSKE